MNLYTLIYTHSLFDRVTLSAMVNHGRVCVYDHGGPCLMTMADNSCFCHLTKHGQPWSAVVIKHGRPWSKTHTRPWLTMVDNHGRPRLFMPFNKTMVDHALLVLDRGRPWFLHPCFHDRCQTRSMTF